MKAILRIFKYCRNRIIALSVENQDLKNKNQELEDEVFRLSADLSYYEQTDDYKYLNTKH